LKLEWVLTTVNAAGTNSLTCLPKHGMHYKLILNSRCVAVDMRGYGDSERPEGVEPYKMEYLIQDVKELIQHLGLFNYLFLIYLIRDQN
jgi:pimeloyl-ACP methyl ester carboxylesterase